MKTETDRTAQTPEDVLKELRSLVLEAEKIVAQTSGGSSSCDMPLEALRERLEAAQERFQKVYEDTRRKLVEGVKYTDQTVREHPYQTVAVALGIGLLAGALLGRRWTKPYTP